MYHVALRPILPLVLVTVLSGCGASRRRHRVEQDRPPALPVLKADTAAQQPSVRTGEGDEAGWRIIGTVRQPDGTLSAWIEKDGKTMVLSEKEFIKLVESGREEEASTDPGEETPMQRLYEEWKARLERER